VALGYLSYNLHVNQHMQIKGMYPGVCRIVIDYVPNGMLCPGDCQAILLGKYLIVVQPLCISTPDNMSNAVIRNRTFWPRICHV
jgi:hypothetical protein